MGYKILHRVLTAHKSNVPYAELIRRLTSSPRYKVGSAITRLAMAARCRDRYYFVHCR
jgi:hypothetical protein